MTNEEILAQVAKYEKGLSNPSIPDSAKETMKKKIAELKVQLEEAEKKSENLEVEEKKVQEDLEQTIAKWEKGLSNPSIPASAKEAIKRKIDEAKEKIAASKKEIKEEKAEAVKEQKEIKEAVKKIDVAAKKKTPAKTPKSPKPKIKVKVKEKEREQKSKKRKGDMQKILTELESLIQKNKKLKEKYVGKQVDLERDAARPAKPFGYRFKGKHDYRVPTAEQRVKNKGKIGYENRANRSDAFPKGVRKTGIKLEKGGTIEKEDYYDDLRVYVQGIGEIYNGQSMKKATISAERYLKKHPKSEVVIIDEKYGDEYDLDGNMKEDNFRKGGKVKRPVANIKKDEQRAAKPMGWRWKNEAVTDGIINKSQLYAKPSAVSIKKYPDYVYVETRETKSDKKPSKRYISLADGGMMKRGGRTKSAIVADKRYKALKAGKRTSEDGNVYYESRPNRSDESRRDRL